MKGTTSLDLNGKEVKLRFTIGVLEDFQEYCEDNGLDADEALQKMKHLRVFISLMSEYAGEKVESEKFKFLDFNEMEKAIDLIHEASPNIKGNFKKK